MKIGQAIRAIRRQRQLTQETVAQRVGITQGTIAHYESGLHNPSYEVLKKIAPALGVSLSELIGMTQEEVAS